MRLQWLSPFFVLFFTFSNLSVVQAKPLKKELCFGAVGKQCAVPGSVKGKPSPLNMVACSKVEKGQTNCWVSPGSIAHDNCCAKNPNGVMCASETKNNGKCAKEWEAAFKDITKKQAWYHVYKLNESANLSLLSSKRMKKFGGQESQSTAALCAPGGSKFLAAHDVGFCCAGKAKKQGEVMICAQETVAKTSAKNKESLLKNVLKQIDELMKKLASLEGQEKRSTEKKIDNLKAEAKKMEQKEKVAMKPQPALSPPPQLPPLPEQYRKPAPPQQKIVEQKKQEPQPMASRPKQEPKLFDFGTKQEEPAAPPPPVEPEYEEEEVTPPPPPEEPVATRPEPAPEEPQPQATPQCDRGTWSPTFGRCIEEQVEEEAAKPDCPAGTHWSPTLQSCQSD